MQGPIFIKGNVDFVIDGIKWEFSTRNVSLHGVHGLPWSVTAASRNFGRLVNANIHFQVPRLATLRVQATVTREKSAQGNQFGLKFLLDPTTHNALSDLLLVYGFYPTGFIRKYPRIPMSGRGTTLPLLATGSIPIKNHAAFKQSIQFDAKNLSLGGILGTTTSPIAYELRPGNRLDLTLALKSDPSAQTLVDSMVCRITDELRPETQQLVQYIAIKFIRVYEDNRQGLLKMLKYIMEQLERHQSSFDLGPEDTQ